MPIITLGSNKTKYLYYLFASLSYIFRNYTEKITGTVLKPPIKLFFMFLGMSLNLILEFILSRKFKDKSKIKFSGDHSVLKLMLIICGISLIDCIGFFLKKFFEILKINDLKKKQHQFRKIERSQSSTWTRTLSLFIRICNNININFLCS